jgi:hypothetical protein
MTQYLTITLDLIEAHPTLHRRLRQRRQLLATLHTLGHELKASHQAWQLRLRDQRPTDDLQSLRSQALELAMAELHDRLSSSDSVDETTPGTTPHD